MTDLTETRHGAVDGPAERAIPGVVPIYSERQGAMPQPAVGIAEPRRIGRDATADIPIDDSQISRLHVELVPAAHGVAVRDLESRNGTFVNGVRVPSKGILVQQGATIRCGRTLLRVVGDVTPFRALGFVATGPLVGGPWLVRMLDQVRSIGPLPHAVLLEGETGTGKEPTARALHEASGRRGPFVALNCGALPAELVESELFGHARGAFSGSDQSRVGLFRSADHGTLLLDEIGELSANAQAKLLRVMEQREVRPVGEDRSIPIDVRVVGATNRDLDSMVATGHFRADLFHRVAAWRIQLQPLRERAEDVPLLVVRFAAPSAVGVSVEAMERLVLWRWPGNVRELRNTVETAAAAALTAGKNAIEPEHIAPVSATSPARSTVPAERTADEIALRAQLETALALRKGNVSRIAKDLGYGRTWLYQLLERFGLDPASYRK